MSKFAIAILSAAAASIASAGSARADDIKIGIVTPMTGQLASEGQDTENAIKLAIDEVNAKGGVLGRKVTTITADDACDPQQGAAAGSKLVSSGVTAILGGYCSGAVLPTLKIYGDADIPFIITTANSSKLVAGNQGNAFMLNSTGIEQAASAISLLKSKNIRSLAVIDEGDAYSSDLAKLTATAFAKDGGDVVDKETVSSGEQDFSSIVSDVKSKNADAVFWTAYQGGGALLTKQLRQAGFKGMILLGDGSGSPEYLQIAGSAAEGVYLLSPPTLNLVSEAKDFANKYKKAFGREPGAYSAFGYDAGHLIVDAIAQANSTEPTNIIHALKTTDYKGLSGEIKFTDKNTLAGSNFVVVIDAGGAWQRAN